ncbi:hypothetical protein AYM40_20900 [Paraburkholderia phytofirmans OLGA172]|uniref:Lipocalin-like domain-containing protein n=1 Tax=Paraburkholderia phytofirmans OLGA172 TaxID=1417228 RepID=A0A160FQD6_9BURK|nr:hypothetical protein [Paraburkholderia phytofirmans]ANB74912.1 hypothetical protein AYM40_20900 [Paraburkholderia phytofirmans OLGA172]
MSHFFRVLAAIVSVVLATNAIADDADPASLLSGGSSREWVFQRIVLSMGTGDECASGETYTFSKTHQLTIKRCLNGHLQTTQQAWSVTTQDGDTLLRIVGDVASPYVLEFKTDSHGSKFMRLRTRAVDKIHAVADKEFKLNKD